MRASFISPGRDHHLWGAQLGSGHFAGGGGGGGVWVWGDGHRPRTHASSSRGWPRGWPAPTFAATPGALLRRLQPRGSQLLPTGPLAPHPHPRRLWRQEHPDGPEGRSSPHRERESPPGLRPLVGAGIGGRRPAAALPGSATRLLWQPFPSEPAAACALLPLLGSLAPSLSLPASLPSSGVGWGRGWPGRGSGAATWGQGAEPPAGRGLAPGPSSARAPDPTAPPPRYSRAQASSSSSSSWLGASGTGPADRARDPGEAAAAPGNGLWQRRRLRELGWSRGARARARTRRVPSPACARARPPAEGPHPQSVAAEDAVPGAKG